MAVTIQSTDLFVGGTTAINLAADGDDLFVTPGTIVSSASDRAILASFGNHNIQLFGTIFAGSTSSSAVFASSDSAIFVGITGSITSNVSSGNSGLRLANGGNSLVNEGSIAATSGIAVLSSGANEILNRGTILGGSVGVFLGLFDTADDLLINEGSIAAGGDGSGGRGASGVHLEGDRTTIINFGTITAAAAEGPGVNVGYSSYGGDGSRVENYGDIVSAVFWGLDLSELAPGNTAEIANFGLISGGEGGIRGALTADDIVNRGLIVGDVALGGGDDRFDGAGGAVEGAVFGGDGNDTLIGGPGADRLNGGAGLDTVDYSSASSAVKVNLTGGFGADADAAGDRLVSFENVIGSGSDDILFGSAAANRLDGGGGNDTLVGADGNDTLNGGTGADDLNGGAGIDTADYAGASGTVQVNLTGGFANGAEAAGDRLTQIENLLGSGFGDILFGSAEANRLNGGAGNDTLVGAAGNDVLIGGAGADSLNGGAGIDFADYSGASGAVQVNLTGGFGNGAEAAGDTLMLIENLAGSGFGDVLFGGAAANRLIGGGGNDTLVGVGGNDVLIGGAGADNLNGGIGADTLVYGATTESGPAAFDTVLGFSSAQNDRIDVSAVDANAALGGNQTFTFIGALPFTDFGQLRFDAAFDFGGSVGPAVLGNTDADLDPELVIAVPNVAAMAAGDFVL